MLQFVGICNHSLQKYYIHLTINIIKKRQYEMGHFLFKSSFAYFLRGLNHESSSVKSPLSTDYSMLYFTLKLRLLTSWFLYFSYTTGTALSSSPALAHSVKYFYTCENETDFKTAGDRESEWKHKRWQ